MKEFFRNKVVRLLMVVALTNLGSMIATGVFFVGLPWILKLHLISEMFLWSVVFLHGDEWRASTRETEGLYFVS